jgi:hypothetical protein
MAPPCLGYERRSLMKGVLAPHPVFDLPELQILGQQVVGSSRERYLHAGTSHGESTRVRLRCTALSVVPESCGIDENAEKYLTATDRRCER